MKWSKEIGKDGEAFNIIQYLDGNQCQYSGVVRGGYSITDILFTYFECLVLF